MPPSVDMTPFDPEDKHGKSKRVVRYILHVVHLIVALLLLAIVIVDLISHLRTFFILYYIPLILVILVMEVSYLICRSPPERVINKLGAFNTLRLRGFVYQAAASLAIIHGSPNRAWYPYRGYPPYGWGTYDQLLRAEMIMGYVVWSIGMTLLILALLAREFGLLEWVEEKNSPRNIHLEESDLEDEELGRALNHPA